MECSIERIKKHIENIASITATPNYGCTRFSYSKEDQEAREYLIDKMNDIGLDIKIDGAGNIRAKYISNIDKNKPSIMIGSHIDTVANGGKFDGVTGVIASLEVINVIKENNVRVNSPIELVVFAEEEGSNFGITLVGSKTLVGKYKLDDLKAIKNDNEDSAYTVMKNFGLNIDDIENQTIQENEIKSMIELHIEQGGILDSENISLGIVQAIVGMKTYKISLYGMSNHAGSTPMYLRNDPMAGASEVIIYIEKIAKESEFKNTVATVGKINCIPNGSNVIAGQVDFNVDIRDVEEQGIEKVSKNLLEKLDEVSNRRGLKYKIDLIGQSNCVYLSKRIIDCIENIALKNNYKFKKMNSGAVHDAVMFTKLTDVGMIFVPSINGISHCMNEDTRFEDIKLGCDLLLKTVIELSNK